MKKLVNTRTKYVAILAITAVLMPAVAAAATRNCPLTDIRQMPTKDGGTEIIIFCNEFYGPLKPGAMIRKMTTGVALDLADIKLPVNARLYTRIDRSGSEIITGIDVGSAADPDKVLYRKGTKQGN